MKNLCTLILLCAIFISCSEPRFDDSDRQMYDPDLNAWRTASWAPFTPSDSITSFAYGYTADMTPGNGRYVAVSSSGIIAWSNDGDIWYRAQAADDSGDNPFEVHFNAVTWGNGRFVATANEGKVSWSQDGIQWNAEGHSGGIDGFGTENILGIAWGRGIFVAVGANSNIAYSADGITWTSCRDASFGGSQLNDIAFDSEGGRFYIVGNDGKRGYNSDPASSSDWNLLELESPITRPFGRNHIRKVTVGRYGSGIGIGIVYNEWGGKRIAIARNADFGNFGPLDEEINAILFNNNNINGIAWGGGNFVAAGTGAMIGFWPNDISGSGEHFWRALTFMEFKSWEITALAACNGRFFVGNVGGKIGYSN